MARPRSARQHEPRDDSRFALFRDSANASTSRRSPGGLRPVTDRGSRLGARDSGLGLDLGAQSFFGGANADEGPIQKQVVDDLQAACEIERPVDQRGGSKQEADKLWADRS